MTHSTGGQLSLLTDTPAARAADPETSHSAAQRFKDRGAKAQHQHLVLRQVRLHPGKTSAELAELYVQKHGGEYGEWRVAFARRMKELEPVHIVRGKPRRCTTTGAMATTWYPVDPNGRAA